jgi:hypothetical protein
VGELLSKLPSLFDDSSGLRSVLMIMESIKIDVSEKEKERYKSFSKTSQEELAASTFL